MDKEGIEHESQEHQVIVGMCCMLGGQLFMALLAILEEHLLTLGENG